MIQEIFYIGQWYLSPLQSMHLGTSQFSQSPSAAPIVFSWISYTVWNLFPFKGDFSRMLPNLGSRVSGPPGWFDVFPKILCTRWNEWEGVLSWSSCQSPAANSCSLLNHLNSFHRGTFKFNAKFDADSLLCLLSHFECDCHTVHTLTQWCLSLPLTSTVKSSLFTHVHSSPLSLAARLHRCGGNHSHYINNGWTFSEQTIYMTYMTVEFFVTMW